MLAIIAAVLFAIAAIFALAGNLALGPVNAAFILYLGLCLLSLHVAGIMARR